MFRTGIERNRNQYEFPSVYLHVQAVRCEAVLREVGRYVSYPLLATNFQASILLVQDVKLERSEAMLEDVLARDVSYPPLCW